MIGSIKTYEPSGKFNPISIPLMLVLGGVFGIIVAYIFHLIWVGVGFYLVFIFPAIMGVAIGFGIFLGVKWGKCRNFLIPLLISLILGFFVYMGMHYFDALSYGYPDLLSYLDAAAEAGFLIFIIPVFGIGAWISWIIEMGILIFVAVVVGTSASEEPYCETCDQWCKDEETLFETTNESSEGIITALRNNEFNRFKEFKNSDFNDQNKLVIGLSYCDNCLKHGYLTIKSITPKNKDKTEENRLIENAVVNATGLDTLLKDFSTEG